MKINLEELKNRSAYINNQKHPTEDLLIWNYSPKCQYEKAWDEYTMMCRGLITDLDGNIVARPFKKFFNYGEIENQVIPLGKFKVYNKFDGSLGIVFNYNGKWQVATRGSFTSEQAIKANEIFNNKELRQYHFWLKEGYTYLFEIIYPGNRIVIDYGNKEMLVLLAVINNETGEELEFNDTPFNYAMEIDGIKDFTTLTDVPKDNVEGFVIKWEDGFRLKMKFDEYKRLHRLVTGFSSKSIWEMLKSGEKIEEILDRVPDEFYEWVKKKKLELEYNYDVIEDKANKGWHEVKIMDTRKEQALTLQEKYSDVQGVVFAMLDNKAYQKVIWQMIKPKYECPFKKIDLNNE